jgi:hypothetical protein
LSHETGWFAGFGPGGYPPSYGGCHSSYHLGVSSRPSSAGAADSPLLGHARSTWRRTSLSHLEAAEVTEARISAEIKVKADTEEKAQELAEQVKVTAEPRDQTLFIKVTKPSGMRDDQLCVDFTITAPAHLALDCATNVGDIQTTGFTQRVKAGTNVGTIGAGLRGAADLHRTSATSRLEYAADAGRDEYDRRHGCRQY